ncbi:MAG: iron ABC transporter permease [Pseudomonadota bacterium]|nr:iron ABC transporter permease [Pseudomonadota bacterium]
MTKTKYTAIFFLTLIMFPILTVFSYLFLPSTEIWTHLVDNLLLTYLLNTIFIVFWVSLFTGLIGVTCAWLVTIYDFPGKDIFKWLLVLPIAIPAYVSAFIYAGSIEPSGIFFTTMEHFFGMGAGIYNFIDMRNIYGVVFILTACLYPYVYLLCYSSFSQQSYCVFEVGRSMGLTNTSCFLKIGLPLARPAIIAGLTFVIMETLAEYGTVDYYGVSTFTTGIFRAWFSFGDENSALHLAAILLTFVFVVLVLEKYSRGNSQYVHTSQMIRKPKQYTLLGLKSVFAFSWCFLIILLSSIIPITQLLVWLIETYSYVFDDSYLQLIWNTTWIAALSAFLIVSVSLYFSYLDRSLKDIITSFSIKVLSLGYSIPGVVIAIGIMVPIAFLDDLHSTLTNGNPFFYISGSFIALILGYLIRFSTISLKTNESGLSKIKTNIDYTARAFGMSKFSIIKKIHVPMMKITIITSLILVFVDVVKELPATLIMRPFNFNTLAVNIYELASAEQLSYIAPSALTLIIISLIPVIILIRNTVSNVYK